MRQLARKVSAVALATAMVFTGIQYTAPQKVEVKAASASDFTTSLFGDNVYVFDEKDSNADIQSVVDKVYRTQETNQFGQERYALLFKPGNYSNVRVKVGFYTQVEGLGNLPTDTVINELDCNADWMGANATCNFWRSAENFTVNNTTTWAAAQATSLRRMYFKNWLALDQWGQGWASGGFVADSRVDATAAAWSEQQFCSRNDSYNAWAGGVWNAVFIGMDPNSKDQDTGNKLASNWQYNPSYQFYTAVEKSPVIRETPYLTVDRNDNYSVYVPSKRTNAVDRSWKNGKEAGKSISIDKFYIAKPNVDNADSINRALASGKHLILTPGIYRVDKPIKVNNPDTVVLGLGYATLTPTGNNSCMDVADVDGVTVSGLLFDAGGSYTETLLEVGPTNSSARHQANPTLLSDLFFRVGGVTSSVAQSKTCLIINSKDVIGDNFWVWRADHGAGVAWNSNKTKNGIVINGDYMTMYGLFVEHFHEYQTVWNGDYGRCYFYQSEIPYDVPNQQSWKSHNGTVDGYSSYKVSDNVTAHEAYGLGIYSFHRDATINLENAMEVPNAANVAVHNVCTVMLAGNPGIKHVINGQGGAVTIAGQRQQVVNYGQGKVEIPSAGNEPQTTVPATTQAPTTTKAPVTTTVPATTQAPTTTKAPVTTQKQTTAQQTTKKEEATTQKGTLNGATNIALNKKAYASTELGNNKADAAIDGNNNSRWESEFADNQYWYVDLGSVSQINEVDINWEAAAGKNYTIDVSNDAKNWTTVSTITNGNGGEVSIGLPVTSARYVRINGITRTTQYGFSIWEVKVMGVAGTVQTTSAPTTTKAPVTTTAKPTTTQAPTTTAKAQVPSKPVGFTFVGNDNDPYSFAWGTTSGAESYNFYIDGVKVASGITGLSYNAKAFASKFTAGEHLVALTASNSAGESAMAYYTYVVKKAPETTKPATTTKAPETTTVKQTLNGATNIALNKKAYASTELGGNKAGLAVDGNNGSRWESEFVDNQYWYVDLGSVSKINEVDINWERAAGKHYTIDVSTDAKNWTTVATITNGAEGETKISLPITNARYVRINGYTRTTQYGFSIWEVKVMGVAGEVQTTTAKPTTTQAPTTTKAPETTNNNNYAAKVTATASSNEGPFTDVCAVDGKKDTRWASDWSNNQWITVDLGQVRKVSKVVLNWEAAYGKEYKIQTSMDGVNFTTVATKTDGKGGIDTLTFNAVDARYVRMQGVTRGTGYGYSLWEFEIY